MDGLLNGATEHRPRGPKDQGARAGSKTQNDYKHTHNDHKNTKRLQRDLMTKKQCKIITKTQNDKMRQKEMHNDHNNTNQLQRDAKQPQRDTKCKRITKTQNDNDHKDANYNRDTKQLQRYKTQKTTKTKLRDTDYHNKMENDHKDTKLPQRHRMTTKRHKTTKRRLQMRT